ncbi:hypothetical protein [Catalinimonas alkaloidigena]|uniref:hypothetical protein n=1 Tax=Catalinimonas alkaloidigena TaxID=1075417 RepID=UPI00115F9562|nr:hypothetical protein [Catalinimonas alkaloidigena]
MESYTISMPVGEFYPLHVIAWSLASAARQTGSILAPRYEAVEEFTQVDPTQKDVTLQLTHERVTDILLVLRPIENYPVPSLRQMLKTMEPARHSLYERFLDVALSYGYQHSPLVVEEMTITPLISKNMPTTPGHVALDVDNSGAAAVLSGAGAPLEPPSGARPLAGPV